MCWDSWLQLVVGCHITGCARLAGGCAAGATPTNTGSPVAARSQASDQSPFLVLCAAKPVTTLPCSPTVKIVHRVLEKPKSFHLSENSCSWFSSIFFVRIFLFGFFCQVWGVVWTRLHLAAGFAEFDWLGLRCCSVWCSALLILVYFPCPAVGNCGASATLTTLSLPQPRQAGVARLLRHYNPDTFSSGVGSLGEPWTWNLYCSMDIDINGFPLLLRANNFPNLSELPALSSLCGWKIGSGTVGCWWDENTVLWQLVSVHHPGFDYWLCKVSCSGGLKLNQENWKLHMWRLGTIGPVPWPAQNCMSVVSETERWGRDLKEKCISVPFTFAELLPTLNLTTQRPGQQLALDQIIISFLIPTVHFLLVTHNQITG